MPYSTLALTPDNDIDLERGWVSGPAAVAAEVQSALMCRRGTYAIDKTHGVDFNLTSGTLGWLGLGAAELLRVTLAVPGVASATIVELGRSDREISYRVTVQVEGETETVDVLTSIGIV